VKNPWMSLWLSAANSMASTYASAARGFWSAEMARQQEAMMEEWLKLWGLQPEPRRRPPARSKRP
jgi:hypothetical protein